MKPGIIIVMILALIATGVFAPVAWAGSSTTAQIIQDASDGTINGHYTVAEVRAALHAVQTNPSITQYSDIEGVLSSYLASLLASPTPNPHKGQTTPSPSGTAPSPSVQGQLDYTGGQPLLLFGLGGALVAAGGLLRRRSAAARRS